LAAAAQPTPTRFGRWFTDGWTDGLPIVPPTRDAVVACLELAVADPAQLVGVEPVRGVAVTAEKLAINAVMAGCLPTHFPVVLACFAAMLRPEFLLLGATASTGGCAVLVVLNGPVRRELDASGGFNALGNSGRATAARRLGSLRVETRHIRFRPSARQAAKTLSIVSNRRPGADPGADRQWLPRCHALRPTCLPHGSHPAQPRSF
jgi:hypothetical protein